MQETQTSGWMGMMEVLGPSLSLPPDPSPHLVYISVVSVMEAVTWRLPGSGLNFPSARVGALISLGEPLFTQVQAGVRVNTHTHTHTHTHTQAAAAPCYVRGVSQGCLHVASFTLTPTALWGRRETPRPVPPPPWLGAAGQGDPIRWTYGLPCILEEPSRVPSPRLEPQPRVRRHLILPSLVPVCPPPVDLRGRLWNSGKGTVTKDHPQGDSGD